MLAHKYSHTVQHHSQDRHKSTLGEEGRQWSKTERVDREKKTGGRRMEIELENREREMLTKETVKYKERRREKESTGENWGTRN